MRNILSSKLDKNYFSDIKSPQKGNQQQQEDAILSDNDDPQLSYFSSSTPSKASTPLSNSILSHSLPNNKLDCPIDLKK